jgi:Gas vesicle synthesis protein GvpL/GvpF
MKAVETVISNTACTPGAVEATAGRKYLYAIVLCDGDRHYGKLGLEGREVYTIAEDSVAAVVSDIATPKVRPERRNLAAHQQVLKTLMANGTPLPMVFGIIADSPAAIRKILHRNRTTFQQQLERVAGKAEMTLRVTWDVPNIFEYFVNTNSELRAARDRLLGSNREPTQEDKIEIGRMFDRCLNETREEHAGKVERILAPACADLVANPCRSEFEVMNLACLVKRSEMDAFEARVFEAAKRFDNNFAFDYNGPWAPHNFVNLDLAP